MAENETTFREDSRKEPEAKRKISDTSKSAVSQFLTDRGIEPKLNEDGTEINFQYEDSNKEPIKVTVKELAKDELYFYVQGYASRLTFELPRGKVENFNNTVEEGFELVKLLGQNGLTVKEGLNYDYNTKSWGGIVKDINGNELDLNITEAEPGKKGFNFIPRDKEGARTFIVKEDKLAQFKDKSGEEVAKTIEEEPAKEIPSIKQPGEKEEKAAMPFVLKGEGERPAKIEEIIEEKIPSFGILKAKGEEKIKLPEAEKTRDLHLRYKGRLPSQARISSGAESEMMMQPKIQSKTTTQPQIQKTGGEKEKMRAKSAEAPAEEEKPQIPEKQKTPEKVVKKEMSNGTKATIATFSAVMGGIGAGIGGPFAYLLLLD